MPDADTEAIAPAGSAPPGTFTLSLDFELLWGTVDLFGPERFRRACEIGACRGDRPAAGPSRHVRDPSDLVRPGTPVPRPCSRPNGIPHPEVVRPRHSWVQGDWFQHDPCSDETRAPLFYGRTLVEKILASRVPHEIGAHSFSHVIYSDSGCSREAAASDLASHRCRGPGARADPAVVRIPAEQHRSPRPPPGVRLFGVPRRRTQWYEQQEPPPPLHRLARLWSVLAASTPPTGSVHTVAPGLFDVPASMIYFPMHGMRRAIPVGRRVRRARTGLGGRRRKRRRVSPLDASYELSRRP